MNQELFLSSFLFGFLLILNLIHCYCHKRTYHLLMFIIIMGIITSMLNHGYRDKRLKYLDRTWMVFSLFYFLYIIRKKNLYSGIIFLFLSVFFYLIKSITKIHKSHLLCHISITIYLFIFIHIYQKKV